MKAAVFVGADKPLEIQELADPTPSAGEVVLKVEHCGICGTDLAFTEAHSYTYPVGFVAGHETSATVVAVGSGVENLKVGDHVVPHPNRGCGKCLDCLAGKPYWCQQRGYNMGGYAQFMLSSAMSCAKLPRSLSLADAALVEPLSVGLLGVESAQMTPGAKVVVFGAGPIGLAAIYWARRLGAGRIIAGASSRRREGLALAMGANRFHIMDDQFHANAVEDLGGAPDLVIECVGVPGMIGNAIDLVGPRGTVSVLGLCMAADTTMPFTALLKEVKVHYAVGTSLYQFRTVADVLDAGNVEPRAMVTDSVSLNGMPTMFEALRQRSSQCKVLVSPWLTANQA
jgi:(R,R)-butanediol dehydrogenase/meso-butanediol dehydrogenase/diacetyl reductase